MITILYIKLLLLLTGGIAWYISLLTGEQVAEQMRQTLLIQRHELFANMAINVFLILCILYIIKRYVREWSNFAWTRKLPSSLKDISLKLVGFVDKFYIPLLLALIWFVLLTIVGALWWAIVHGSSVDPVVERIYNNFWSGNLW